MNYITSLSKDTVKDFLKKQFPDSKDIYVHFDTYLDPVIHVIISYDSDLGDELCYDFMLSQFEVRSFPSIKEINTKIWHNFMVSIFGNDYEQAYINHAVS